MTTLFFVFAIATIGYLIGGIEVKGISLGTAGVLLAALVYGVVANQVGSFQVGEHTIVLFDNDTIKPLYSVISSLGTALFVTAVGLIAGPKFFRNFHKSSISYVLMGLIVIVAGILTTVVIKLLSGISSSMAVGLLTGALTSTPGLSAAKDAAADPDAVTAGYGIAYLFGILGVVFFVQLVPRFLHVNIEEERRKFVAHDVQHLRIRRRVLKKIDGLDFFPFMMTVFGGLILGSLKIPGINFSLGSSGGTLIMGLIVGHFGHLGKIDLSEDKHTLNFFRELGLMLFLIGAGVPGGVNFVRYVRASYFIYGAIMTLVPMILGFILGKYVFKLSIFNNLGSLTGGMTSTPALGTLISVAGTDDVAAAYAATYPIALVVVVLLSKFLVTVF
ncbi:MAG: YidE/YbjL duplication [Oscillospiraceae bacterium]|nr:YidE/YbjL duplication [Oscillospiraceae bacterium]